jgi:DNA-binding NtrC family response regulator
LSATAHRVLIVEDNADTRYLFTLVLREAGFDVTARACCEEAERDIDSGVVRVAVMDVRLPGQLGHHYACGIVMRSPQTRILFVTGEPDHSEIRRAVPDAQVLAKPVSLEQLISEVRALCDDR